VDQANKSYRVVVEVQDLLQNEVLTQSRKPPGVSTQSFISCEEIDQASTEVVKLVQKEAFEDIRRDSKIMTPFPT